MKTWFVDVVRSVNSDGSPSTVHRSGPFTSRELAEQAAVGLAGGAYPPAWVSIVEGPDSADDDARDKDADDGTRNSIEVLDFSQMQAHLTIDEGRPVLKRTGNQDESGLPPFQIGWL